LDGIAFAEVKYLPVAETCHGLEKQNWPHEHNHALKEKSPVGRFTSAVERPVVIEHGKQILWLDLCSRRIAMV
jgi:hypothetical protein